MSKPFEGYPFIVVNVTPPPEIAIVNMLTDGLQKNFAEVSVEYVDCPDLRQKPFNLAAPGLCGNPALLQVGGLSNVYPSRKYDKIYNIQELLQTFDRHHSDAFVIGAGLCRQLSTIPNGELYMNILISPKAGKTVPFINKSKVLFVNKSDMCESQPYYSMYCSMYGNFFISEGQPGRVVKVYAKKRIGPLDFISAMQCSIRYRLSEYMIDFGGTFVVNNGKVSNHLMPPISSNTILPNINSVKRWLRYYNMRTPLTAVGTFSNRTRHFLGNETRGYDDVLNITQQHFHTFSSIQKIGGHYYIDMPEENMTTEYLGYFCPTKKLYCVDPVCINKELSEFNLEFSDNPELTQSQRVWSDM